MNISILVTFILLFTTAVVFSQNEINQLDGQGKRHGIWKKNFNNSEQIRYEGVFNHGKESFIINNKDRVAQMVLTPVIKMEFEETDNLPDTLRGEGGFGSTGK